MTLPLHHLALRDGAEFDAIRLLLSVWGEAAEGIGDDAAILDVPAGEQLVVSTDACIENAHFRRGWLTPEEIGARAAAAALSDLAAMGATPRGLLLSIALPDGWRDSLAGIAHGVGEVAASVACPIIGGNMSTASELSLTTTVLGSTSRPLRRDGVQAGDAICVTGRLGGPGAAWQALERGEVPLPEHRARFARPTPRIAEGIWLASRGAHAAIDISDGLFADSEHLAAASGVSIVLDPASVPCVHNVLREDAMLSGEEYELLVAMPPVLVTPELVAEFEDTFGIPLTVVGIASADASTSLRTTPGLAP